MENYYLFNKTKYTRWYFNIINNAKTQQQVGYSEKHHIIPKSLGGKNDKSNIVLLNAKAHFISHLLLPKMCITTNDKRRMVYAFYRMSHSSKYTKDRYTSSLYSFHKENFIKLISGKNHPLYGRSDLFIGSKNPFFGKKHSKETMIKFHNKVVSEESKRKMSKAKKGIKTGPCLSKGHIGELNSMYGKPRTKEVKAKIRSTRSLRNQEENKKSYSRVKSIEERLKIKESRKLQRVCRISDHMEMSIQNFWRFLK